MYGEPFASGRGEEKNAVPTIRPPCRYHTLRFHGIALGVLLYIDVVRSSDLRQSLTARLRTAPKRLVSGLILSFESLSRNPFPN
jgi:hypothetical protein